MTQYQYLSRVSSGVLCMSSDSESNVDSGVSGQVLVFFENDILILLSMQGLFHFHLSMTATEGQPGRNIENLLIIVICTKFSK